MNEADFGPLQRDGGVEFRLWAPDANSVEVVTDHPSRMHKSNDGRFSLFVPHLESGTRYHFRIDDEIDVPDPASHFQPDDISGDSAVVDHAAFQWRATDWRGLPWHECVFCEVHVGTYTSQGTYRAMIEKLDHLVETGFTALELMPLADFPGGWNWGYDGVLWYAPDSTYGHPDDLKALIDEAHSRGLMVFLDVVYNHFGPEGNYLGRYAPSFFSQSQTPWGNAIDYRIPQVRSFAIQNALHWLRNYRFDGLRLDAVHAIVEAGEPSILTDLSTAAGELAARDGRQIHLVLENDDNRASLLDPASDPPRGKYRAQWNDDYHHAWHVLLTSETTGYYGDYRTPLGHIARVLDSGFAYQGDASRHRGGVNRGELSRELSPAAFVNFLQNHDQIGNRAFGDRLEDQASATQIEAALAITLLAPMVPLMFMGEEWGAKTPFPFFCDFSGELANAVREGRRREFSAAYAKHGDEVPDPLDQTTFKSAKLNWADLGHARGRNRLALVKKLLALRRSEILPHLAAVKFDSAKCQDELLTAQWRLGNDNLLRLTANLSERPISNNSNIGRVIWGHSGSTLSPWSVIWSREQT